MGCLFITGFIFCFLICLCMGLAAWGSGDYFISILLYLSSIGVAIALIRKVKRIQENSTDLINNQNKDKLIQHPFKIDIKTHIENKDIIDENDLKEVENKRELELEAILNQHSGYKYHNIKTLKIKNYSFDICYEREVDLLSDLLYRFFNRFINLQNISDFIELDRNFEPYQKELKCFIKIKNRSDFIRIYREAKHNYRVLLESSFPRIISQAVSNPDLFIVDFDKICLDLAYNYEEYWTSVLKNYKQKTAFENRRKYLITNIDSILLMKCIQGHQSAIDKLKSFRATVNSMEF